MRGNRRRRAALLGATPAVSRSSRPSAIRCYDTAPHLSVHRINFQDVAGFLADRFAALDASTLEPVGHGEWSKAYLFGTRDGRDLVARFSQFDDDFLKDQRAWALAGGEATGPRAPEGRPEFAR